MSDYQLKRINSDFWLRCKVYAVEHGFTMKALILEALRYYMSCHSK